MTTSTDLSLPLSGDIIAFGPFQLDRRRHELLRGGVPVSVGSRAIAILLELTRSAGEILSNTELLRRVWPDTFVEAGTVRVHIAQLRRVMRDADPSNDYVQNVTNRGYRFVAPILREGETARSSNTPGRSLVAHRTAPTSIIEPLRASGESTRELASLDVPPELGDHTRAALLDFPAIQLFLDRAETSADAAFDGDDLLLIADVCRLLAGNPLAIEIAAAHVGPLGLNMLATSLYLSIDDRDTESRHRSLRDTFDWSYARLASTEQATFRRLSMFSGSFDLECALAAVVDESLNEIDVFESLMSLARKSLVIADTGGETGSYRLHDLTRAYAREKLLESGEVDVSFRSRSSFLSWQLGEEG
ncbi:MAG: winged helix-turn-helix domain-containing protein [Steroidobacteraceae bacterium]